MKNVLLLISLMVPSLALADVPFGDMTFEEASQKVTDSERLRKELAKDPDDPQVKLKLGRALVLDGENEEASELFLWCWDHGAEMGERSFSSVRVSFLLNDMKLLAAKHKPMRLALIQRRDSLKIALLREPLSYASTNDFIKLNRALGCAPSTLEVYDLLMDESEGPHRQAPKRRTDPLRQLFDEVTPLMVDAGRYEQVIAGFGDPLTWLEREVRYMEMIKGSSKDDDTTYLKYVSDGTVKHANYLYLALLGTGKHDPVAAQLATKLVEFTPAADTWEALIASAEKVKRDDIVKDLRAAAQAAEDSRPR